MFYLKHSDNNLWYGQFSIFPQDKIIHAISTRFNGNSKQPFNWLNLAFHVGDNPCDVIFNRQKFATALNLSSEKITTCQQIHGNKVVCVTQENIGAGAFSLKDTILNTDALITNIVNVPLTLFFADCTPIMIYDPIHHAIGLIHAGWRGTVEKIALQTIISMQKAYNTNPSDCLCSIGPSIGKCCYEVGNDVADKFKKAFKVDNTKILTYDNKSCKYHLDLCLVNALILEQIGLIKNNIELANTCTACNSNIFYSYRADKGCTGRIAGIIALK